MRNAGFLVLIVTCSVAACSDPNDRTAAPVSSDAANDPEEGSAPDLPDGFANDASDGGRAPTDSAGSAETTVGDSGADAIPSDTVLPITDTGSPTTGCPPAAPGWRAMAARSTEPSPYGGIFNGTVSPAMWTGSEMIVHGTVETSTVVAAYNPATNTWRALPGSYVDEHGFGVPAGAHYLSLWRGRSSGYRLDVSTGAWTAMAVGPRPHYEANSVYVPATNEMIVWSGVDEDGASLSDGIAYNVGANSWRTIAASPLSARKYASAVWDGSRVIYAFGCTGAGTACTDVGDAAAYDPVLDTWTMLPVPPAAKRTRTLAHRTIGASGAELAAFFGGTSSGAPTHDGLLFDTPWTTWKTLPDPLLPGAARIEFGAWTGASGKLFVWGGVSAKSDGTSEHFADGAVFDPIASTWTPMPSGGPSARRAPVGVWTGCDTIVFGGASAAGWEATGMLYRP